MALRTALRPSTNTYAKNTSSASTPMPMRAQVGSPDGVTNASMTPLTSSTTTRPSATVAAVRPSRAIDAVRVMIAWFDPRPEQPQSDATGDEDGGQLEQAVREDQAPEQLAPVVPRS